mmetsp:Transcript_22435/g.66139  ORF Transcript_22435/g.66139 Transcript_22435/m.66139 type:complete len:253 (-) Transcript_22435:156-914(-)
MRIFARTVPILFSALSHHNLRSPNSSHAAVFSLTAGRYTNASPEQVIRFWFGDEWFENSMETDAYRERQIKRWFMGGKEMDEQAREFIPRIREAGTGKLTTPEWTSRDGLTAQVVLLDQLSRNAFRGDKEAFAYDARCVEMATSLLDSAKDDPATLPWPVVFFCSTSLMHSENLQKHQLARRFLEQHVATSESPFLKNQLDTALPEHTAVLEKFGRYPHRNALYGRKTTPEEQAWLDSDECPGWAKSQKAES